MTLWVKNSGRVWLLSSHWGLPCGCNQRQVGLKFSKFTWSGHPRWLTLVTGSWCWLTNGISVALSTRTPVQGLLSMVLAFLQHGGPRIVGFLTWQLTVPNISVPRTKLKAALEFTKQHFCWIVLVMSESLRPAQIRGRGQNGHFLMGRLQKICGHILKLSRCPLYDSSR